MGTVSKSLGLSSCSQCEPGEFNNRTGQQDCVQVLFSGCVSVSGWLIASDWNP